MDSYKQYQKLLDSFNGCDFSFGDKKEANIFGVSGYPHYENVASNILKFFFDTTKEHGFNDLWLKSLLKVYNQKSGDVIDLSLLETSDVKREYSGDKRIDLLIDARPLIIVIENKIGAGVYNPFDVYTQMAMNYIEEKKINDYKLIRIVLSVSKESLDKRIGFINITYDELFEKIDELWSDYQPNKKWELFAIDFINNLRSEKENTNMDLDQKWIQFVDENGKTLGELINDYESSIAERASVCDAINSKLNDLEFDMGVYNYRASTYVSHYINIKMSNATVCIETYLMKYATKLNYEDYDKLYISLWCRRNKNYDFDYILKAINKEDAPKRVTEGPGSWGKHYILDEISLRETLNLNEIAEKIREYVVKIDELNK